MRLRTYIFVFLLTFLSYSVSGKGIRAFDNSFSETVIVKLGITEGRISSEWKNALSTRMTASELDSVSNIRKLLTSDEKAWIAFIESKATRWNLFKDSLEVPFRDCHAPDTIYVLLGFLGIDDGFTYQNNTVCFDLSALQNNYGSALEPINDERIDRLFAHEFTHLVHKEWARKNKLTLKSFKDSVLWECAYEGIGMYRSLSKKWLPQKGSLPEITKSTLEQLYPIFVDKFIAVENSERISTCEKNEIVADLSRGPVAKKWGAFTVAIWLALEANGNDKNLVYWTDIGLNSINLLAQKYLTGKDKIKFEKTYFNNTGN